MTTISMIGLFASSLIGVATVILGIVNEHQKEAKEVKENVR